MYQDFLTTSRANAWQLCETWTGRQLSDPCHLVGKVFCMPQTASRSQSTQSPTPPHSEISSPGFLLPPVSLSFLPFSPSCPLVTSGQLHLHFTFPTKQPELFDSFLPFLPLLSIPLSSPHCRAARACVSLLVRGLTLLARASWRWSLGIHSSRLLHPTKECAHFLTKSAPINKKKGRSNPRRKTLKTYSFRREVTRDIVAALRAAPAFVATFSHICHICGSTSRRNDDFLQTSVLW